MKHHSQIPQQRNKIQKILFPPKHSSSAQSCSDPPPQPITPSNLKPIPTTSTSTAAATASTADSSKSRTRLFTANDEILILKSLSDYKSKTGHDPMKHFTAFYNSCKNSLSFESTQRQLYRRVWKLKNKFEKNKQDHAFSSPHENELFELSLKFWGQDNNSDEQKLEKSDVDVDKESAKGRNKDEKIDNCLREMFRFDEMGLNMLKRGMELVGESERLELDRRWKRLRVQESRVFIMRAELVEEQLDLIYNELLRSS